MYTNAFYQDEYVRVGMVKDVNLSPFRKWSNNYDVVGFEKELVDKLLTEYLNVKYVIIPLKTLDERITAIQEDKVDIVVSSFSVTLERMLQVKFIEPYYYSSYPAFFTLEELAQELNEKAKAYNMDVVKTLDGQRLCVKKGYFIE